MEHIGQRFENTTVVLDGNSFRDCSFRDVVFRYGGGELVMSRCEMDRFSFQFDGNLAQGLFALYQLFGTDGMLKIIRGFTDPGPDQIVEL
jgi:hypothetical protein